MLVGLWIPQKPIVSELLGQLSRSVLVKQKKVVQALSGAFVFINTPVLFINVVETDKVCRLHVHVR